MSSGGPRWLFRIRSGRLNHKDTAMRLPIISKNECRKRIRADEQLNSINLSLSLSDNRDDRPKKKKKTTFKRCADDAESVLRDLLWKKKIFFFKIECKLYKKKIEEHTHSGSWPVRRPIEEEESLGRVLTTMIYGRAFGNRQITTCGAHLTLRSVPTRRVKKQFSWPGTSK